MSEMTAELAGKLRAPFPSEAVKKLPRVTCKRCRDSLSKNCDQHQKSRCNQCGNWITSAHMHLDYVGHAETTDRLLQVDPEWSWEPVAFGPDGLPALDGNGGLWMRLTVAGVTRIGYGHADGKNGADAIKEAIGDAIRNAAMRFGVAIDLWGASGATDHTDDAPAEANGQVHGRGEPPPLSPADEARQRLLVLCNDLNLSAAQVGAAYADQYGKAIRFEDDAGKIDGFTAALKSDPDAVLAAEAATT